MKSFVLLSYIVFFTAFFAHTGHAGMVSTPHAQVELISDFSQITSNQNFRGGLHFKLEKDWHVYWQNPGDSGEAPKIQWIDPKGFEIGQILWPTPNRLEAPPLVTYGYEDEVVFPFTVQAASDRRGEKTELVAKAKWLICREVCIPGKAELKLPLTFGENSVSSPQGPLIEAAFNQIPKNFPGKVKLVEAPDHFSLELRTGKKETSVVFFPLDSLQIDNAAKQALTPLEDGIQIDLKKSEQFTGHLSELRGVAVFSSGESFKIGRDRVSNAPSSILKMLLFALLGGLILNLMPCVFPVLSIKVLSLLKISGSNKGEIKKHGWAYTSGILVSFWILVGALIALRSGGEQLGWGFQLQSPTFIAVLACVLFLMGLNLAGVFEIGTTLMSAGSDLAEKPGLQGSFFTGVLATVVATPCSAPFMGSAIGFAITQPPVTNILIFTFLGLGLALPYLILCYSPALIRYLPKPGRWMESFKQLLSFAMFAVVVWLAWVFGMQTDFESVITLLSAILALGFGAWIYGRWPTKNLAQSLGLLFILCTFVGLISKIHNFTPTTKTNSSVASNDGLAWETYSPEKLAEYQKSARPVFLDFTAAWCVSCKVNELLVFRSEEVLDLFRKHQIIAMKADWTSHDAAITQALESFGRSGVPLYVLYSGNAKPHVFPEVINATLVINEIKTLLKEKKP